MGCTTDRKLLGSKEERQTRHHPGTSWMDAQLWNESYKQPKMTFRMCELSSPSEFTFVQLLGDLQFFSLDQLNLIVSLYLLNSPFLSIILRSIHLINAAIKRQLYIFESSLKGISGIPLKVASFKFPRVFWDCLFFVRSLSRGGHPHCDTTL